MIVLSLFDGIACGRVALERSGIKVDKYYASEIEKNSIRVAKENYPDIIQLGDARYLDFGKLQHVDLLIGGSTCSYWSNARTSLRKQENDIQVGPDMICFACLLML